MNVNLTKMYTMYKCTSYWTHNVQFILSIEVFTFINRLIQYFIPCLICFRFLHWYGLCITYDCIVRCCVNDHHTILCHKATQTRLFMFSKRKVKWSVVITIIFGLFFQNDLYDHSYSDYCGWVYSVWSFVLWENVKMFFEK